MRALAAAPFLTEGLGCFALFGTCISAARRRKGKRVRDREERESARATQAEHSVASMQPAPIAEVAGTPEASKAGGAPSPVKGGGDGGARSLSWLDPASLTCTRQHKYRSFRGDSLPSRWPRSPPPKASSCGKRMCKPCAKSIQHSVSYSEVVQSLSLLIADAARRDPAHGERPVHIAHIACAPP